MTLDEAIQACDRESFTNALCSKDWQQLSAWLTELKELREKDEERFQKAMNPTTLEQEYAEWFNTHFHGKRDISLSGEYLTRKTQLELARHFAEWQKVEDDGMNKAVKASVSAIHKLCDEHYAAGFNNGQQLLLKDAIDGYIVKDRNLPYPTLEYGRMDLALKDPINGNKDKIIVFTQEFEKSLEDSTTDDTEITEELLLLYGFESHPQEGHHTKYVKYDEYREVELYEYSDTIWIFHHHDVEFSTPDTQITVCDLSQLLQALSLCGCPDLLTPVPEK